MIGAEFNSDEEWLNQPYRVGVKLHPLTIEQNAITSFRSRTTLVPNVGVDIKRIAPDLSVYAYGKEGKDDKAEFLLDALRRNGVNADGIKRAETLGTSFTQVMSIEGGERTFFTYAGASADFGYDDIDFDKITAKLIAENELILDKYKWKHINIWHCPYYMHAGISHFKQVVLQDDRNYIRAIKPQFCELGYAIEEQSESQDKIGGMFWGFPEIIKYDSTSEKTWDRLYLYEERYSDKAAACRDLDNTEKINLRSFCGDIFGDG